MPRRYDERITVGGVPGEEEIAQLRALGCRTLVDSRMKSEVFDGATERHARKLRVNYISAPINRDEMTIEDTCRFLRAVHEKGSAPIYAFSRSGREPLALLLLFEAILCGCQVLWILQRASEFGLDLEGDECLHRYIVGNFDNPAFLEIVNAVYCSRPDLFDR